jgi:protein TonB
VRLFFVLALPVPVLFYIPCKKYHHGNKRPQKALKDDVPSLDDIIFEGRNKAYGAYLLRKLYHRHLAFATVITTSLFVLFISLPLVAYFCEKEEMYAAVPKPPAKGHEFNELPQFEKPTPPPPPDPLPPQPRVKPQARFVTPKVTPDNQVTQEEMPEMASLDGKDIGTENVAGDPNAPTPPFELDVPAGTGESSNANEPFVWVSEMSTFPGDADAMNKYLSKHLRYPSTAQRKGTEGLVVLSFTVGATGEISNIEVVKSLGDGTDEEAVRVVKSMPKWTPGKQNGRAVPVRLTLPIRFAIH